MHPPPLLSIAKNKQTKNFFMNTVILYEQNYIPANPDSQETGTNYSEIFSKRNIPKSISHSILRTNLYRNRDT